MNISIIRYILGWVLAIEGGFMFLPCLVAVIYGESSGWYFAVIGTIAALPGLCMIRKNLRAISSISGREALLLH